PPGTRSASAAAARSLLVGSGEPLADGWLIVGLLARGPKGSSDPRRSCPHGAIVSTRSWCVPSTADLRAKGSSLGAGLFPRGWSGASPEGSTDAHRHDRHARGAGALRRF